MSNRPMDYGYLDGDKILRIYRKLEEELGFCTLGRVVDYCKRKGIINPVTGKPPTRQGIYNALLKTEEGKLIISKASHANYINRPPVGWPEERRNRDIERAKINVPKVG